MLRETIGKKISHTILSFCFLMLTFDHFMLICWFFIFLKENIVVFLEESLGSLADVPAIINIINLIL